jgi:hypothetical protein
LEWLWVSASEWVSRNYNTGKASLRDCTRESDDVVILLENTSGHAKFLKEYTTASAYVPSIWTSNGSNPRKVMKRTSDGATMLMGGPGGPTV